LNVCFLNNKGYKISKIAKFSAAEIKEELTKHSGVDLNKKDTIDLLMVFLQDLDSYNISTIFNRYIEQLGLERTMNELIYPFMDRLGVAWISGQFQNMHESFITQLIKKKIQRCISELPEKTGFDPSYIIYLPPGEQQELSLLYMHYLLREQKCKVVNLGYDVGMHDVIAACKIVKPNYLFTIINNELPVIPIEDYINEISASIIPAKMLSTGFQVMSLQREISQKIIIFKNLEETMNFIKGKES